MPTEKIADIEMPCLDPDHNVPGMCCFEPGTYKHTCPSCGNVIVFTVPMVMSYSGKGSADATWGRFMGAGLRRSQDRAVGP